MQSPFDQKDLKNLKINIDLLSAKPFQLQNNGTDESIETIDPMLVFEPEKFKKLEDERMKECLDILGYKSKSDFNLSPFNGLIKGCHLKVLA